MNYLELEIASRKERQEGAKVLHQAIVTADRETIISILNQYPALLDEVHEVQHLENFSKFPGEALTPLLIATRVGHLSIIKFLLAQGADPTVLSAQNGPIINQAGGTIMYQAGSTIMHEAAQQGRIEVLAYLSNAVREFMEVREADDSYAFTPLMWVDEEGRLSAINARDSDNNTPLMTATRAGHLSVIKFLVDNGANLLDRSGGYGSTVFHSAAQQSNIAVLAYLFTVVPELMDDNNDKHESPLMYAAKAGHLSVIQFLLAQGADPTVLNENDETIIHYAAQQGNQEIVAQLLGITPQFMDDPNQFGQTPLMFAIQAGHLAVVQFFSDRGANKAVLDENQDTVIHYAVQQSNPEVLAFLLNIASQFIDTKNKWGKTPLRLAVQHGSSLGVELLLQYRANPNIQDNRGRTALRDAIQHKKEEITKLLLSFDRSIIQDTDPYKFFLRYSNDPSFAEKITSFLFEQGHPQSEPHVQSSQTDRQFTLR